MTNQNDSIIFDNPLAWGPASAFNDSEEMQPDQWWVRRGFYGTTGGLMVGVKPDWNTPELRLDPGLSGWHDVRIRVYHGFRKETHTDTWGIYARTSNDRALRQLRPELGSEDYESLSLGPRDMTGADLIIDGAYRDCFLDSVEFVPCDPPAALPPAEKEVCGILDFADSPDAYRPMEECAAEMVRVHAEAGFTTLFWKAYAVRCEYQTKIGDLRSKDLQPEKRITVGHLLEKYDTLEAAAAAAAACGIKLLGWMRINNEFAGGTSSEWTKFSKVTTFRKNHPELCEREKDGSPSHRLSFAYPEVREYLCSLGSEILDRGVQGLLIDVLRHPPMARYDKPLVDAFVEQTGENPLEMAGDGSEEWLRVKCTAFTDLLRDFRKMMESTGHKDKPIYVRAMPQPWRLLRDGCDVDAWLREGLVDTFVAGHHIIISPGHPTHYDLSPIQGLIDGRARLVAQVARNSEIHTARALTRQAYEQGADGIAIYESNAMVEFPHFRDAIREFREEE